MIPVASAMSLLLVYRRRNWIKQWGRGAYSLVVFSSFLVFLFFGGEGEGRKSRSLSQKSTHHLLGGQDTLPRNDLCHLWNFIHHTFFPRKRPVCFLSSLVALAKEKQGSDLLTTFIRPLSLSHLV